MHSNPYQQAVMLYTKLSSIRRVSEIVGISRTKLSKIIELAIDLDFLSKDGTQVKSKNFGQILYEKYHEKSESTFQKIDPVEILKKLPEKGFTRKSEYQKYFDESIRAGNRPASYQTFSRIVRNSTIEGNPVLKKNHNPGETLHFDFSSNGHVFIINGEKHRLQVGVYSMGYSGYIFVDILASQTIIDFCRSLERALEFYGRLPETFLSDNFAAYVIKRKNDIPVYSQAVVDIMKHYNIYPEAARPRKPKDKAVVERCVQLIQQKVIRPISSTDFESIDHLQDAIKAKVHECNAVPYRGLSESRYELYTRVDYPQMRELPVMKYHLHEYKAAILPRNYHISIDNIFYSAPYKYIGKYVTARISKDMVEILHQGEVIATHKRDNNNIHTVTNKEHMPGRHRSWSNNIDEVLDKCENEIGNHAKLFAESIDGPRIVGHVRIRALEIQKFARSFGANDVEKCCEYALQVGIREISGLCNALETKAWKVGVKEPVTSVKSVTQDNENVRGKGYYNA